MKFRRVGTTRLDSQGVERPPEWADTDFGLDQQPECAVCDAAQDERPLHPYRQAGVGTYYLCEECEPPSDPGAPS